MISFNDFRLVMDLYENVAIIGKDLKLIYVGKSLAELLKQEDVDLDTITSQANKNKNQLSIAASISKLVTSKQTQIIPLPDSEELIAFFSDDAETIFIGLKEKITRVQTIEYQLKERVKELECLYGVSKEMDSPKRSIDEILYNCTKLIEKSFQFPDDTAVNIEIGKKNYGEIKYDSQQIKDVLASNIHLGDVKKGEVKAFLKNDLGFLDEEKKLLDEIALKIESLIERQEKTVNYEKQQKILSAKNEALIRMTEECYQKREKLNTFIKAISEIIVVVDHEFNIVMSNKDGIGDEGKCFNKIFGLNERCADCPAIITFVSAQDAASERIHEEKNILLDTHPIRSSDGKVDRVLEVCRDVTNQKQLESQLIQSYKLASLGKLVAGVAHEINNPNTFILGNLKIINESFEDIFPILDDYFKSHDDLKIARLNYNIFKENISVLVNDMINGANRTKKIVSDLRNFAKKDDGALTDDVDINYIIKNNLTLTRKHIKKYAGLEVNLNEDIPTFKGSFNKIEQVLLNLAINGSEAIEHDHGVVTISTNYDAKNNEVVLIVSDNGSGMSDATIKNIFDPFFTTKRDKGGTGLGLSITYGIIREINGKIEVTSKVGVGTTFTIRIPATR